VSSKQIERAITRRTLLKGFASGLAMATLAACGGTPVPATTAPQPAAPTATSAPAATQAAPEPTAATQAPTAAEPTATTQAEAPAATVAQAVNLEFWCAWNLGEDVDRVQKMLDLFKQVQPNINVKLIGGGPGGGDYNELLLSRIAAGTAPDAATLFTPPVGFAARGSLDVIDDLMDAAQYARHDKFWPTVLATCQFRGKTFGLPFSASSYAIFYNADWMKEAGLPTDRESFPKTFDDMKALSAKFVKWEGSNLKTAGFQPWSENWIYPVWSALNGSQFFSAKAEKYTINSSENVALLDSWVQWLDDQYNGDIEYINSLGTWDVGDSGNWYKKMTPFGQGGAWNTSYSFMKLDKIGFTWDVAKFPVGPNGKKSVTGFWPNWFVQPAGGKHRKEAFLLNEYMCTVGMATWYKNVFDTPAWLDFPTNVITQNLIDNVGQEKAQDLHNFFRNYLEDTAEVWTSPIEDFGTDQINRAFDQALHKTKKPQEALDEAQKITQAKLEETLKSA